METTTADRETEASKVLYNLLSIERIASRKGTKANSKKKHNDAAQSTDLFEQSSTTPLKVSQGKAPELEKTGISKPQNLAGLSENEDVDKIVNLDIDNSSTPATVKRNPELTGDEGDEGAKISQKKKQRSTKSKQKKVRTDGEASYDPTRLEDDAVQVLERFKRGCECQDDHCFSGLNPESVYRHRLNIAELTKAEHDMYLMGVTMACLTNPYQTARHTERRRLRAQYVYQGRRVCLDAFLYLENCTHYQIKRIRKHLITQGVTPRVHGNHGKIPHNTFSLDIYKIATEFLKSFINKQETKQKTTARQGPLHLASDVTRKTVHDLYTNYCRKLSPDIKIMGYSTFRRFMKVQFPQVKFAKVEFVVKGQQNTSQNQNFTLKGDTEKRDDETSRALVATGNELVPLVLTNGTVEQNGAYLLTPVSKLQNGVSYQLTPGGFLVKSSNTPSIVTNVNSI
ncbi:uncharacterized protein LOC105684128 [Athalia rosae]|uniref:uncharacterized protein LOC105684128 n=1 Tax=Athalia rosae TaxID=37344 RepID=UPI002033522C|nr:uncharacterized protein LOC105684128 [Athalia rosae]